MCWLSTCSLQSSIASTFRRRAEPPLILNSNLLHAHVWKIFLRMFPFYLTFFVIVLTLEHVFFFRGHVFRLIKLPNQLLCWFFWKSKHERNLTLVLQKLRLEKKRFASLTVLTNHQIVHKSIVQGPQKSFFDFSSLRRPIPQLERSLYLLVGNPSGKRHLARSVEFPALLRGDGIRGEAHPAPATHLHQSSSETLKGRDTLDASFKLPYVLFVKRKDSVFHFS